MIKKEILDKTSAWPFVEAKKMLRERKSFIDKKGKITLQQDMVQVAFLILEHLEKLQGPQ